MAKQMKVGESFLVETTSREWSTTNPDCISIFEMYDEPKEGEEPKFSAVQIAAKSVTPEGEPAIVRDNGNTYLRINVVPADEPVSPVSEPPPSTPTENA